MLILNSGDHIPGITVWIVLAGLLLPGCVKETAQPPYVARVDQALLTEEEFAAVRDSLQALRHQTREYINDWVTNELLYQEALRQGLTDTDELRRQVEAVRKHLAVAALLEKELYADDTSMVNEDAVAAMYNSGGEAFFLRQDVANMSFALFAERDAANSFRSMVLRGTSWSDAIRHVQLDSLLGEKLLKFASRQYVTEANLYPEELWKLSRALGRDEVSFVLKTDDGYYVLIVHGMKRKGEMPDLDYARNEIRDRLQIEQRRYRYEKLIEKLKTSHLVEIRIDLTDTTSAAASQAREDTGSVQ